jgi:hypothetical protein
MTLDKPEKNPFLTTDLNQKNRDKIAISCAIYAFFQVLTIEA